MWPAKPKELPNPGIEDGHWGEKQVLEVEMKNQISVLKKEERMIKW